MVEEVPAVGEEIGTLVRDIAARGVQRGQGRRLAAAGRHGVQRRLPVGEEDDARRRPASSRRAIADRGDGPRHGIGEADDLQLPIGKEAKGAAVGGPERAVGGVGSRQHARLRCVERADPELRPAGAFLDGDECQVPPVRREHGARGERVAFRRILLEANRARRRQPSRRHRGRAHGQHGGRHGRRSAQPASDPAGSRRPQGAPAPGRKQRRLAVGRGRGDGPDEPVSAPRHRGDVCRLAGVVAEDASEDGNTVGQAVVGHEGVGPDQLDELFLLDHPVAVFDRAPEACRSSWPAAESVACRWNSSRFDRSSRNGPKA